MIKINEPEFLKVKPGDTVLVGEDEIAKVLSFVGGARDPDATSLFQVANVYSGEIKFVQGEEVKQILSKRELRLKIMFESLFTKCP
ncbi:DUF3104 domain-containing protein [Prochlorococcus marinus]|uniref:DUF3104 domain-containing protein n=1 Tax=Prochlorococcus marinus TaxID=1219 RepID=UPI0022B2ADB3|nr:DUF3104 domain-containing protein [Prochlorococcus marinus]